MTFRDDTSKMSVFGTSHTNQFPYAQRVLKRATLELNALDKENAELCRQKKQSRTSADARTRRR